MEKKKKKSVEVKELYHTIEKNETRWSLMKKYGVTAENLERLNPNFSGKWLRLRTGDKIRVK